MVALSTHRRRSGFTLVELLVVIVIIGILAGLLLPVIAHAIFRAKVTNCLHNQNQLYKLGTLYAASHKGQWPSPRGEELWLSLKRTVPPLIEEGHLEVLACPAHEDPLGPDETHFRGPAVPMGKISAAEPLGADKIGNHGERYGGNVLLKDGSVHEVELTDPLWELCASKLSP